MQTLNKFLLLAGLSATFIFASCEKDDPEIPNEEEVITTLTYTLTPVSGGDVVTLTFQDLDGDGGNDPIISGGSLEANKAYTGKLSLLNETEDPAGDIGEEVKEEDKEHQFFFQVSANLNLTVIYADVDADGNPVGLDTAISTGEASQGQLTIILRHEPNKSAAGVAGGDVTNAGGETDIEVTFDVDII